MVSNIGLPAYASAVELFREVAQELGEAEEKERYQGSWGEYYLRRPEEERPAWFEEWFKKTLEGR